MKKLLIALTLVFGSFSFADETKTLVSCTPKNISGAARYQLVQNTTTNEYSIVKDNPSTGPANKAYSITVSNQNMVFGYDKTWIAFRNMGRSGYALFQYNGKNEELMIDINLFQPQARELNTKPLTKDTYKCSASTN